MLIVLFWVIGCLHTVLGAMGNIVLVATDVFLVTLSFCQWLHVLGITFPSFCIALFMVHCSAVVLVGVVLVLAFAIFFI